MSNLSKSLRMLSFPSRGAVVATGASATRAISPLSSFFYPHLTVSSSRSISSSAMVSKVSDDQRYTKPEWANNTRQPVLFEELKQITSSPDDRILLIDVREPDEVVLGSIPSSVNLPLSSFEKSLSMDEGDFTRVHGFHKPALGQQIIFYCRSGKRSATALDLAKKRGYRALRNYDGSYLDWSAKATQDD